MRGEGERNKLIQLRIYNIFNPPPQFSRLGIHVSLEYVCWSGLWLGGLLYISKASVLCTLYDQITMYMYIYMYDEVLTMVLICSGLAQVMSQLLVARLTSGGRWERLR